MNNTKEEKKETILTEEGTDIQTGEPLYELVKELFPICRSITGNGFRKSLQIIKKYVPSLEVHEVKSGTKVFDWTVPEEWNIEEAYIEDEEGNRIIDFKEHNLHVLGYSTPIEQWFDLEELKQHIYTQEKQPDVIPYVTSYYTKRWGFCMSKNQLDSLQEGRYHAVIKSEHNEKGSLTYGEAFFPGESEKEVLISTYLCHPSMANNECSGPAVSAYLARLVAGMKHRKYGYRFVYIPETIGSITWLSQNFERFQLKDRVVAGFVLTCVGDDRDYSFISTRYGDTLTDKILRNILQYHYPDYKEYSFLKRGSDERQYNAPGIDLPVCSVCRTRFGSYPEYHTSADDLSLVTPTGLFGAYEVMKKCIHVLEKNAYYKIKVFCEPQLGKRNLYPTISQKGKYGASRVLTNFIAYCDGKNDLLDISNRIGVDTDTLIELLKQLLKCDLLDSYETIQN